MATPDWDFYRSFLAVMEAGSLSGAARALGVAQPTIGRHIEALERALGGDPLFTRSPGGLRPTRAAQALAPHAKAMAVAAETLIRTASGDADEVRGVVRLTAWPGVEIELVLSNQIEDLLHRDVDIAVRMARPTQNALTARRVGSVPLRFHGHRSYLQKYGEPRTWDELKSHTLIGYDRVPLPASATRDIGFEVTRDNFALRTDNELAHLALLRAGAGLCPVQAPIAARDPNLVPVMADKFHFDLALWVVMHEDLKTDRRMRRLFDHLVVGLKAYIDGPEAGYEAP